MSDIRAERQSSDAVPTPLKKAEPSTPQWKKGGSTSVADVLSTDKSSIRKPVDK